MCCKSFWKKVVSFALAFLLGLLVVGISQTVVSFNKAQELLNKENDAVKIPEKETVYKEIYIKQGSGFSGGCFGEDSPKNKNITPVKPFDPKNKRLNILYKPRPLYTAQARANNTQGTVTLRVTFLSNGEIGGVSPISVLSDGLTEQAIAAAKQIKFEPQLVNGRPQTVVKSVQFSFTIY